MVPTPFYTDEVSMRLHPHPVANFSVHSSKCLQHTVASVVVDQALKFTTRAREMSQVPHANCQRAFLHGTLEKFGSESDPEIVCHACPCVSWPRLTVKFAAKKTTLVDTKLNPPSSRLIARMHSKFSFLGTPGSCPGDRSKLMHQLSQYIENQAIAKTLGTSLSTSSTTDT